MKYRRFGTLDWKVSVLGFGVMRLPMAGGTPARIDEKESIAMIRYAIDEGVNYVDLGYLYDATYDEAVTRVVAGALRDGYRQKIRITLTIPSFLAGSSLKSTFDRFLNDHLRWLETEGVDFCLVGRLNRDNWPDLEERGVLDWIDRQLTVGNIGRAGFSLHDHYQILRSIIGAYDKWSVCQLQYSYMDIDHDPGTSGLKYAAEKGLAVVVTEPLKGGRLTEEPPEPVAEVWAKAGQRRSPAEWGLRFVWNEGAVSTVVCDMSTMEHVQEDAALAEAAEADSLGVGELVLVSRVRDAYRKLRPIPCPSCRACMPCPLGIDVPRIFELYNDAVVYRDTATGRLFYRGEGHSGGSCSECGACVNACAKRLPILEWLGPTHRLLAGSE